MSRMEKFLVAVLLAAALTGAGALFSPAGCETVPPGGAPAKPPARILLVHSYHAEYPWVQAITRGVETGLAGKNAVLEIYYMDTKRKTSDEWKTEAGRLARDKIDAWKPDAVIAADDNAQLFVTRKYVGKKPWFVFCGVNGDPAAYGLPASNVTGILERPNLPAAVDLLHEIVPGVKRIAIMSDTDPTSVGSLSFMRGQQVPLKILDFKLIDSFDLWKQRISEYNREADALCIYMYHTVKDGVSPQSMLPKDVMAWTRENCAVPTVGFFEFSIEDGMLCGVVESGEEHGFEAAGMALALTGGADISTLPVHTAVKRLRMLNLATAERLGIAVPENTLRSMDKIWR